MEFWETLNQAWIKARAGTVNEIIDELRAKQAYRKMSEEEHEEVRKSLREYNPEDHTYNGPFVDDWVSGGVAHAIDFREICDDFIHPDWEKGYDV